MSEPKAESVPDSPERCSAPPNGGSAWSCGLFFMNKRPVACAHECLWERQIDGSGAA